MAQERLQIRLDAIDNTTRALKSVRGGLARITSAAFSLRGALVSLGAGLVIRSFVNTGRSIEDLRIRLNALFGSTIQGAKAFDTMTEFASRVPFSLEEIQAASGNLAIVAGDAERLSTVLEITGNVAAATGLDFQQTAEQIQRSFAGGIAAADVFRERGVRDMLGFKAGATITAEETVEAFQRVFGKGGEFGNVTQELSGTFTGTLSMLGDKLFNFKKDVAGEGFFDQLKEEFKSLDKFIENNAEQFETIGKAISEVLTVAVKGFAAAIRGVARAVQAVKDAITFLTGKEFKAAIDNVPYGIGRAAEEAKKKLTPTLVKSKTVLEEVAEELENINKKFTTSSIIIDTVRMGTKGISDGIARSIVLGEKLNDTFRKLAQQILINVISKLIEKRLLALAELAIEKIKTTELYKQLAVTKAINKEKSKGTKQSFASSAFNVIGSFLGRAEGGTVKAGQPYITGERGRELFIPETNGTIVPNEQMGAMGATNINFTIVANDTRDFDRLLIERRSTITNLINQALNQQGRKALV